MSHESNVSGTLYVRDRADYRPATPQEIIAAARGALSRRFRRGSSLESPAAVRDYLRLSLTELGHEVFCMILLDLCGALRYVVLSRFNIGFIDRVSRRTQH